MRYHYTTCIRWKVNQSIIANNVQILRRLPGGRFNCVRERTLFQVRATTDFITSEALPLQDPSLRLRFVRTFRLAQFVIFFCANIRPVQTMSVRGLDGRHFIGCSDRAGYYYSSHSSIQSHDDLFGHSSPNPGHEHTRVCYGIYIYIYIGTLVLKFSRYSCSSSRLVFTITRCIRISICFSYKRAFYTQPPR